ncbi:hypothetical protein SNK04_009575 [Fusarium graminearum]
MARNRKGAPAPCGAKNARGGRGGRGGGDPFVAAEIIYPRHHKSTSPETKLLDLHLPTKPVRPRNMITPRGDTLAYGRDQ